MSHDPFSPIADRADTASTYTDAETEVMAAIARIEDVAIPELMKGLPSEDAKTRVAAWRMARWHSETKARRGRPPK